MTKVLEAPKPINIRSRKADSEEWPSLVPGGGTIWGARANEDVPSRTLKASTSLDDEFPALGEAVRRAPPRQSTEQADAKTSQASLSDIASQADRMREAARRAAERKADEEAREAEQRERALAKLRELELRSKANARSGDRAQP